MGKSECEQKEQCGPLLLRQLLRLLLRLPPSFASRILLVALVLLAVLVLRRQVAHVPCSRHV